MIKNNYEQRAQNEPRKNDLLSLLEFGFTDFVVNKYLLEKHNDCNRVAEMLMTGQVSENEIAEINAAAAMIN